MRAVALKELEHLVERGETVLVTASPAPLADAVQKGWIQRAASAGGAPPRMPVTTLGDLLQELQRDRKDR